MRKTGSGEDEEEWDEGRKEESDRGAVSSNSRTEDTPSKNRSDGGMGRDHLLENHSVAKKSFSSSRSCTPFLISTTVTSATACAASPDVRPTSTFCRSPRICGEGPSPGSTLDVGSASCRDTWTVERPRLALPGLSEPLTHTQRRNTGQDLRETIAMSRSKKTIRDVLCVKGRGTLARTRQASTARL